MPRPAGRTLIFLAVCALGISAAVTQLTLMRELLSVFSGNEMIFGVILGNWLLLTGIGAYLGRTAGRIRRPVTWLMIAQILLAVLPVASVFAVRTLRNVVFLRGAMIGVTESVASCFVLLAPYCLISGYLLTLACTILATRQTARSIGQVYFLDSLGDIAGGLLFTFVLVHLFSHFGCLYVPAFLNLFFAAALAVVRRRAALLAAAVVVAGGLAALIAAVDLDETATRIEYAGFRVLYRGHSPYGALVVTESGGQLNFIENGVPLLSTHNIGDVEETVHYAMAQRPRAARVLLISGGISGTAREILKYGGVDRVDYVELDPLIVQVGRRYLPEALADPRIRVIEADGRSFVRWTQQRYDVVIADLPDPVTSQLNRYYTREFFGQVKRRLNPGGVLCFSLGEYANYVGKELGRLIATAHRTLREAFANVRILPAGRLFFLASDGELTTNVADRIEAAGVETKLVNRSYLDAMFSPGRLADVARPTADSADVNTDFSPVLYYYRLLYWISRFELRFGLLEVLLIAALVIYLARIRLVPFALFTTGFAASG
ncbi:MAG TPA: fused MFS/spermidine synthase, partial [Phycisphaerae bacterium]|nr:fused MFS/spermidine synthase [Phycisphaerae bacterium]